MSEGEKFRYLVAGPEARDAASNVYVIGPVAVGPYKIGVARSVAERLRHIQTLSPVELVAHYARPMKRVEAFAVEGMAHLALKKERTRGEWFDVGVEVAKQAVDTATAALEAGEIQRKAGTRDQGDGLANMHRAGRLTWEQYEAGLALRELCKRSTDGGFFRAEDYAKHSGSMRLQEVIGAVRAETNKVAVAYLAAIAVRERNLTSLVHAGPMREMAEAELKRALDVVASCLTKHYRSLTA